MPIPTDAQPRRAIEGRKPEEAIVQKIARVAAALFVLVGGGVHFQLWRTGYRGIEYIGPLFIVNVSVSALLILAIVLRSDIRIALAAMVFSLGSIVALVMSRTSGLLGFTERAWTDLAVQALTAEVGALVALSLFVALKRRPQLTPATVRVGPPQ